MKLSQEPYRWTSVASKSRTALEIRYSILPYYYTLFYKAHRDPIPKDPAAVVLKPLFFEFSDDINTYEIDKQFMVGSGILISPILQQGIEKLSYCHCIWCIRCFKYQCLFPQWSMV